MKIRILFLMAIHCTLCSAQSYKVNESLDRFFAGIPVRESYEAWVHYIFRNPYLGVDSFSERGAFSSFKPGIKDHFPFADTIPVKILFQKIIYYDSITNISTDSTNEISIEAIFADNRKGDKESGKVFTELRRALRRKYKVENFEDYLNGTEVFFSGGYTESFPDCSLSAAYSKELHFHFVMLTYTSPRKKKRK